MMVLVLLGEGADVRVPPQRDPRSGRVREEWLVREVDPASALALEMALALKHAAAERETAGVAAGGAAMPAMRELAMRAGGAAVEVTAIHMGPETAQTYLQQALALGCDRAIRVWEEQCAGLHAAGAAVVLAAAAQAAEFDVVFCGATSVVDAGGQLGQLVAARLGVPCVTRAVEVGGASPDDGAWTSERLEILRDLDAGYRERVRADLPLVVTVSPPAAGSGSPALPVLSARALLAAQQCDLPVWDLADLGVPFEDVRAAERALSYGEAQPRRPRLTPISAPDPALPAFDRILKLIEGTVKRREGRIVKEPPETVAEEIFASLRDEGWLDHLRLAGETGSSRGNPSQGLRVHPERGRET